jgi:hypothetical protein
MLRIACCFLVFAACTSGDDSNGGSQLEGDCEGSASECGQISVRWSIMRPSQSGAATCADVGASSVRVITTFQPDGRTATYTPTCVSGAALTPKMPLGPYTLSVDLMDASNAVVSTEATTATIGVAGTVTETNVVFRVVSGGRAGELFGICSASVPCKNGNSCVTSNGVSMCTPACNAQTAQTVCNNAARSIDASLESVGCFPTTLPADSGYCFVSCEGAGASCPSGLTCRDLGTYVRNVCAP